MGQPDSARRVRMAITRVMEENGIPYRDDFRSGRRAISFTALGHERTITYSGGDYRADKNARTQARRILTELGVVLVQKSAFASMAESEKPTEMDTHSNMSMNKPENDAQTETGAMENSDETKPSVTAAVTLERSYAADDATGHMTAETPLRVDDEYVLFTSTKYNMPQFRPSTGHFIAIILDRDLIASKGEVLVIPTHLDNVVWEMPLHQFRCCFEPARSAVAPGEPIRDQTATVPPAEIPPVVLQQQPEPTVRRRESEAARRDVIVEDAEPATVASFPPPRKHGSDQSSIPNGVSPQLGRVLMAMYYLKRNGQTKVASSAMQEILTAGDARQVAGMMGQAVKLGWVKRLNVATSGGRGYNYKLTIVGERVAETLGTWPWDVREMDYPSWLLVAEDDGYQTMARG